MLKRLLPESLFERVRRRAVDERGVEGPEARPVADDGRVATTERPERVQQDRRGRLIQQLESDKNAAPPERGWQVGRGAERYFRPT